MSEWGIPVVFFPITVVLFLFPVWLVFTGWKHAVKVSPDTPEFSYRSKFTTASLFAAGISTLAGVAYMLAWLGSGGDPHGMGAPPGVWQFFCVYSGGHSS